MFTLINNKVLALLKRKKENSFNNVFIVGIFIMMFFVGGLFTVNLAHAATTWTVDVNSNVTDCVAATTDATSAITTCKTIQSAIDAASNGDTIDVAPGTYTGNININVPLLTLQSYSGNASDTTITGRVELSANNDTVQNLTITNPNGNFGVLINGVNDATVMDNIVNAVGTGVIVGTGNNYGIYYQSHSTGNTSGISITGNTISTIGSTSNGSNGGIGIGDSKGAGTISTVTIKDNKISAITANANSYSAGGRGAYGILVNHGSSAGGTAGVIITHNTISNLNGYWATAVGLEGPTPNTDVKYNTIKDIPNSSGTYPGVAFNFEDNLYAGSVTLQNNTVYTATVPAFVSNKVSGTTVDATDNYWGTAVHSIIAGKMFNSPLLGTVTFAPYYVDSAMTILSNASVNDVYINASWADGNTLPTGDYFGYNAFAKIQNGVDATALSTTTPFGTVHVAAGNYPENVVVNRAVKIISANAAIDPNGTISRNTEAAIDPSSGTSVTVKSSGVTLNGFTISPNGSVGISVASGMSNENFAYNIFNDITGASAKGIYLGAGQSTMTIAHNLFSNIKSSDSAVYGVYVGNYSTGTVASSTGIAISNNTFDSIKTTVSSSDATPQYAIAYGIYTDNSQGAGLTITGNTFSNLSGFGTHAIGLEGPTLNASITGNTFKTLSATATGQAAYDKFGIFFQDNPDGGSATISNNKFDGGKADFGGVAVDTNDTTTGYTVDATSNWWGDKTGPWDPIAAGGLNPNGLGVYVSKNVTYSPWFTTSDMTTFESTIDGDISAKTPIKVTKNGTSDGVEVTATIPAGTTITGNSSWDGTIEAPTATTTTIKTPDGYSSVNVTSAISIGSSDSDLTFDKAVKLTFTGQAGKLVGWYNHAGTFTEITNVCNSLTAPTLTAGSSCKIDATNDTDLIVWTKHFSTFVTYTQTPIITTAGGGTFTPAPVASTPVVAPVVSPVVVAAPISTTPTAPAGQVLGAETYNFSLRLASGSKGDEVKQLQTFIKNLDFNCGPKDGIFGPKTKAGVIYLQLTNHLVGDGIVGPLTRAVLNK